MSQKVKFKIGGMEYCIESEEDEDYIKALAFDLDHRINSIAKKSPFLSTTAAAVVAALEAYDGRKKQLMENETLRTELKRALESAACAKFEVENLKSRLAQYEEESNNSGYQY